MANISYRPNPDAKNLTSEQGDVISKAADTMKNSYNMLYFACTLLEQLEDGEFTLEAEPLAEILAPLVDSLNAGCSDLTALLFTEVHHG